MTEHLAGKLTEIFRRLEAAFSAPDARQLTRKQRGEVTSILERALDHVVAVVEPGMFVEIGSFDADFSRRMKRLYPKVSALALEANPRVFARFEAEVRAAGVDYRHLAAADKSGEVSFFIPETIRGNVTPHISRMGSLYELGAENSEMHEVRVPSVALDALLAQDKAERLCLWIDVEGAIDKVLNGATETLKRTALLYCEVEDRPVWKHQPLVSDVVARLRAEGFVPAARDFQTPVQFNMLFVRTDLGEMEDLLKSLSAYADRAVAAVHYLTS